MSMFAKMQWTYMGSAKSMEELLHTSILEEGML